jgi:hypothetical protein
VVENAFELVVWDVNLVVIARVTVIAGRAALDREVNQIGMEIMRAHIVAVDTFGSPSAEQVARYHFQIFQAHGLPASTFGGAPISGTEAEAGMTSDVWMGGC